MLEKKTNTARYWSKKIVSIVDRGKILSNQEINNFIRISGVETKYYCSSECMIGEENPVKAPKNNNENKGMSTEMKLFLGTLVVILVFIIGIALGKIWQKNKNNKK